MTERPFVFASDSESKDVMPTVLIERLRVAPTVILPDMGDRTIDVATSIRQLMVDRTDAADALAREMAGRLAAEAATERVTTDAWKKVRELEATVERLEAALRFYANWSVDNGARARAALSPEPKP
jgi:uncharacterized alpha-E superfamily protein